MANSNLKLRVMAQAMSDRVNIIRFNLVQLETEIINFNKYIAEEDAKKLLKTYKKPKANTVKRKKV